MSIDIIKTLIRKLATQGTSFSLETLDLLKLIITEWFRYDKY